MIRETVLIGTAIATVPAQEMNQLFQSPDWNTLADIWNSLNRLKLTDEYTGFPMEGEKGDSLIAVIQGLFPEGSVSDPSLREALNTVTALTVSRTRRLSRVNPALVTRMMPPWTATVRDGLLFNFESRITELTYLVDSGDISAGAYAGARDSLLNRAVTHSVLEILNEVSDGGLYDMPFPDSRTITPDTLLKRLELSCQAALDTLAKETPSRYADHYEMLVEQHGEFQERYRRFTGIEPILRALLSQLMEVRR